MAVGCSWWGVLPHGEGDVLSVDPCRHDIPRSPVEHHSVWASSFWEQRIWPGAVCSVARAPGECHVPEFSLVNLGNFLFQFLWMFREKLELGAIAFRVLSWVVIPNLRFSKVEKKKKNKINTWLGGQGTRQTLSLALGWKRAGSQGADVCFLSLLHTVG